MITFEGSHNLPKEQPESNRMKRKRKERRGVVLLEGTLRSYLVQLSDLFRANQKLKNISENIIQTPFKH